MHIMVHVLFHQVAVVSTVKFTNLILFHTLRRRYYRLKFPNSAIQMSETPNTRHESSNFKYSAKLPILGVSSHSLVATTMRCHIIMLHFPSHLFSTSWFECLPAAVLLVLVLIFPFLDQKQTKLWLLNVQEHLLMVMRRKDLLRRLDSWSSVHKLSEIFGVDSSTVYDLKKQK